jgi:Xaa-Pro aminopeptidase
VRCLAILALLVCPVIGADPFFPNQYQIRRDALRAAWPDKVMVFRGANERPHGDLRSGFFQEPNFLYLTGWREPGAALIVSPKGDVLLLPKRNDVRERYTGRKVAPGDPDIRERTGVSRVEEIDRLDEILEEGKWGRAPEEETRLAVARLRMIKSPAEIERIEASTAATIEAHKAAWKRIRGGLYEYQVAATMMAAYFERGCERSAYPPIVASGPNSIVLHYSANKRKMDAGELLLMDVGAECGDYAADITRTVPVSGKFTPRQREIYEVVLGAQKAAIAAARPGIKLTGDEGSLNRIALDYVNAHGKGPKGEQLGKYYLHQLGHHVGLEVHDAFDPKMELKAGMVVTIEPGIYIAEENIGVRIEDVVLITGQGARVLSSALPKEAKEIEKALGRK